MSMSLLYLLFGVLLYDPDSASQLHTYLLMYTYKNNNVGNINTYIFLIAFQIPSKQIIISF